MYVFSVKMSKKELATIKFWEHRRIFILSQFDYFNYLTSDDQDTYHQELKLVRKQLRAGSIISVKSGTTITVGSKELYTMDVAMANKLCYPNMLLKRRGLFDDAYNTPYFFTSEKSRDKAVTFITKKWLDLYNMR